MCKIQRIRESQLTLSYKNPLENFEAHYGSFLSSDLGKIYQAIPWQQLVESFGIKDKGKGPLSAFSPQGKIALMLLKHYDGSSDKRLLEQLNGNIHYQLFCGILLEPGQVLKDHKLISKVRTTLGNRLDIDHAQQLLADYWKPYMKGLHAILTDATCYESELSYPNDQRLLWEATEWCHGQLKRICKTSKQQMPRSKYLKWKERYFIYSRKKKQGRIKEKRVLTRGLLQLLKKLLTYLEVYQQQDSIELPQKYYHRKQVIAKLYQQQHRLFTTGQKPSNRIVSISKSYVRPIVRGKETKAVEFGAKVNKIQIDGINFIEHLSFDAFNEGTRLQASIYKGQQLMHTTIDMVGADAIYATNKNRTYCRKRNIRTDFVRKGRASIHEPHRKQLAAMIRKERGSRLEGSFGKEKEHYHLRKIKARTKANEILWIFFGIHTANALEIGRRLQQQMLSKAA